MIEFPYVEKYGRSLPLVPLTLYNAEGDPVVRALCLVDSGATISLFNSSVAQDLGIEVEEGEPLTTRGIGGEVQAYVHRIRCSVAAQTITGPVAFTKHLNTPFQIIGRRGFFERFLIQFDELDRKVYFSPVSGY